MKIKEILDAKGEATIYSVAPKDHLMAAVRIMCDRNVGSVVVLDPENHPVGIFTERDVLKTINSDVDHLRNIRVQDVMTRNLVCGVPSDDVDYVMQIMTEDRIRHLPIVEKGKLVGMVSIGDVVRNRYEKTAAERRLLLDYLELDGKL